MALRLQWPSSDCSPPWVVENLRQSVCCNHMFSHATNLPAAIALERAVQLVALKLGFGTLSPSKEPSNLQLAKSDGGPGGV